MRDQLEQKWGAGRLRGRKNRPSRFRKGITGHNEVCAHVQDEKRRWHEIAHPLDRFSILNYSTARNVSAPNKGVVGKIRPTAFRKRFVWYLNRAWYEVSEL